jgi:uncharacterized membrane protein YkvA (DUF1232 family)
MTENKPIVDAGQRVGAITSLVSNVRLIWRLFTDRRVPWWTKLIPLAALAYVIWPFDLALDTMLGLGQLDDLAIVLLGLKTFVSLSPAAIVAQYRNQLRQASDGAESAVDASYQVLDDDRAND